MGLPLRWRPEPPPWRPAGHAHGGGAAAAAAAAGRRGRGGGRGLVVVTLGSSERPRKGGKLGEILEMHPPT